MSEELCACGRLHASRVETILCERGAIAKLPAFLSAKKIARVYLFADPNTYRAAGERTERTLTAAGIAVSTFVFSELRPKPDEGTVGAAVLHYDPKADAIVAVGSGVMNDVGKILSKMTGKPEIIVATAPSMDGYASDSSSMERDGLKVTIYNKCPEIIVGDLDVLCAAPMRMMLSGLGDMIAKYVSVCEWRIGHIVTGEYYCEKIADIMRSAVRKCVGAADGLLRRDPEAVREVFEGLVMGGVAMQYAGVSRPASGIEHYFSHLWDMRGLAFGTATDLHGIQCAVGTLYTSRLYRILLSLSPNRESAEKYVESFDYPAWCETLREAVGAGAGAMIEAEKKEGKYDPVRHKERLSRILSHWDEIRAIVEEELPAPKVLEDLYLRIGLPTSAKEIGTDTLPLDLVFRMTKDVRNKYILSHLAFDLGVLDTLADSL